MGIRLACHWIFIREQPPDILVAHTIISDSTAAPWNIHWNCSQILTLLLSSRLLRPTYISRDQKIQMILIWGRPHFPAPAKQQRCHATSLNSTAVPLLINGITDGAALPPPPETSHEGHNESRTVINIQDADSEATHWQLHRIREHRTFSPNYEESEVESEPFSSR